MFGVFWDLSCFLLCLLTLLLLLRSGLYCTQCIFVRLWHHLFFQLKQSLSFFFFLFLMSHGTHNATGETTLFWDSDAHGEEPSWCCRGAAATSLTSNELNWEGRTSQRRFIGRFLLKLGCVQETCEAVWPVIDQSWINFIFFIDFILFFIL